MSNESGSYLQRSSRAEKVQLFSINSLRNNQGNSDFLQLSFWLKTLHLIMIIGNLKQRKLGPECLNIGGGGDVEHMGLLTPNDQLHDDF